jgi:hypothetical protein
MHSLIHDLLLCSLTGLTPAGGVVVRAITLSGGAFVSSSALARGLGLKDRYALDRLLHNEGLPTYKQLSGWIRVLGWVLDWEKERVALSSSALRTGKNAGIYARTVRRVTGLSWTQVRVRGSTWVLLELVSRCRLARLSEESRAVRQLAGASSPSSPTSPAPTRFAC